MKYLSSLFLVLACIAIVSSQHFIPARVRRQFNFNPSGFAQLGSSVRDPRQNRGPVVFPPSPPDAIDETSGVIVGASGYGFVPPGQSQTYFATVPLDTPSASYAAYNFYTDPYTQHGFSFF